MENDLVWKKPHLSDSFMQFPLYVEWFQILFDEMSSYKIAMYQLYADSTVCGMISSIFYEVLLYKIWHGSYEAQSHLMVSAYELLSNGYFCFCI